MVLTKYILNNESLFSDDSKLIGIKRPFDDLTMQSVHDKLEQTTCTDKDNHTSEIIVNIDTSDMKIKHCCILSENKFNKK